MSDSGKLPDNRKVIVYSSRFVGNRIKKVFEQNGNKWETIEGIAASAKIPPSLVRSHIRYHSSSYKSPRITVGGIALYALNKDIESVESSTKTAIRPLSPVIVAKQSGSREPFRGKVIITNVPKANKLKS